ncbi:DUF2474 domain-containing protein [Paraburkholderia sp. PGU19]|nr:DUF2474 domain-containing protein [Paraburkholderia sp. PGU19]
MEKHRSSLREWGTRFAWLVALWTASVAALGVVASLLHLAMRAAGLSG